LVNFVRSLSFFCAATGLLGLLTACDSETLPAPSEQAGSNFFPLEVGRFAEYTIERIDYTLVSEPDTQRYLLREVVADSFPGQGGEVVYRLERSIRDNASQAWQLDSVWTARKNAQRVVVVVNNQPLIKLVFPPRPGIQWDAHALSSREAMLYELRASPSVLLDEINSPLDSTLWMNSLTVIQAESRDTIITNVQASETYAEDLGLVYKKSLKLAYCASDPECVGIGQLESGYIYRQTLTAYGKEE